MTQIDPFSLINPDVVCVNDLDLYGTECTTDLDVLQQDVFHLLLEDPGSNLDDPDRGIGIIGYLSGTSDQLKGVAHIIDRQLVKDDRIDGSQTTVTQQPDGSWLIVVEVNVDQSVIPLSFQLSQTGGLQLKT